MMVSLPPIYRTLIKVAFGFCHQILGWSWTGSANANGLRAAARGLTSDADVVASIQGVLVDFRGMLPINPSAWDHHVVALVPGRAPYIFVSLFGDQMFTVMVPLTATSDTIEGGIAASDRMMVVVDPRSRQANWTCVAAFVQGFAEKAARRAAAGSI